MAKARFEAYANTQQQDTAKGLPKMVGHLLYLVIFFLIGHSIAQEAVDNRQCELLKASLTYTQEEAPRDLSGLLPLIVGRVNQALDGVVDVQVEWTGGDLHGRVGKHLILCQVTRLSEALGESESAATITMDEYGRQVTAQCFQVPFTIKDTNECLLPAGHAMRHECQSPSRCVNTIGSYECVCPLLNEHDDMQLQQQEGSAAFWDALEKQRRSPWELSLGQKSSCPSKASTYGCCPSTWTSTHTEGSSCRRRFTCPSDTCREHDCTSSATCVRAESPLTRPSYTCQCASGMLGNGHTCRSGDPKPAPKVRFDGVTPTEGTVRANFCGCTKPVVDACAGFPPCKGKHELCVVSGKNVPGCACKPGFVRHATYGCVDERPPVLKLKNDPKNDHTLRLKQGDTYHEYAVEILDDNAEEYLRSLQISYSRPLPHGCLTDIGEFTVNYTVAMPWATPPYVRIQRRVLIEDINECKLDVRLYKEKCPSLIPHCDTASGAVCENTIGSYTCKCPRYTTGDGFLKGLSFKEGRSPHGFAGGQACHDNHKPIITLKGPNPKVFRTCACSGISGKKGDGFALDLQQRQQSHYSSEIRDLVKSSAGAELCATHGHPSPQALDCIRAIDETHRGDVDLSKRVTVGEPVQKSAVQWAVPYNVADDAGNEADTVWRTVVVEQVELADVEEKVRSEILKERESIVQRAVDKALAEERRRVGSATGSGSRVTKPCPKCPECHCKAEGHSAVDLDKACLEYCSSGSDTCTMDDLGMLGHLVQFLEVYLSRRVSHGFVLLGFVFLVFLAVRFVVSLLAPSTGSSLDLYNLQRIQALENSVTYYNNNGAPSVTSPPPGSVSGLPPGPSQASVPFFSPPPANHLNGNMSGSQGMRSPGFSSPSGLGSPDIYAQQETIISPSMTGDGVRRRSPFSRRTPPR